MTLPLTISVFLPKSFYPAGELEIILVTLGWGKNRLKAIRKPLHGNQFFTFSLSR